MPQSTVASAEPQRDAELVELPAHLSEIEGADCNALFPVFGRTKAFWNFEGGELDPFPPCPPVSSRGKGSLARRPMKGERPAEI